MEKNNIIIFRPQSGGAEFNVVLDGGNDTVWATELQISKIFGRDRTVINRHLRNSYKEGELNKSSTSAKIALVQMEGGRRVERLVTHYNLDVILSIGYRVKSIIATEFRKWATARLKEYLIQGYSINQKRLDDLKQSVRLIQKAAVLDDNSESKGIIKVLSDYALGLEILDGYDNQSLQVDNVTKTTSYKISYTESKEAIAQLKEKFGGSNLFGNEKDASFKSSISTIDQTFDGEDLYPSIEEKAANLLYFVVKNHSFSDGNKRIAAWLFVWYLSQNNYLYSNEGKQKIGNNALASLTLMIALSNPNEKELMIKVIVNSINKNN